MRSSGFGRAARSKADGRARAPRLFIVELELAERSSHYFNQCLGFKWAAERSGLEACVLFRKDVEDSLAEPLAARRVIELEPAPRGEFDYALDEFAEGARQLRSLWAAMEAMAISRDDIVLITSGRPVVIYALGEWLARLDGAQRPAVFLRFYDHPYLDPKLAAFSPQSGQYRFAARDLSLRPGQERVFFTVNNRRLIEPLEQLCERRVFEMPLPKHYGDGDEATGTDVRSPVIYAHVNARCGVMGEQIQPVLAGILGAYPNVRVLLKYTSDAVPSGAGAGSSETLSGRSVERVPSEQSHSDYLRTLSRSHVVLLPYEGEAYAGLASGVFAEGVALGKVMVHPDNGWMADQVAQDRAVGIGFDATNRAEIDAALRRALDALPDLWVAAQERARRFRDHHSCQHNLERMLDLASQRHDMSIAYELGSSIRFGGNPLARRHLGEGWSKTETLGVWSDGPEAELRFPTREELAGPLDVHVLLTPYCGGEGFQSVTLSVNGSEVCDWSFSGPEDRVPVWRSLTIPGELVAGNEIRMRLLVKRPQSPRQLGESDDERLLGVLLQEIRIDRAAPAAARVVAATKS